MYLDFTHHGLKEAAKEFALSILKTMLAAGIAFVIAKLAEFQIPLDNAHSAELLAGVGLLRAVLTSVFQWVSTPNPKLQVAEQIVG